MKKLGYVIITIGFLAGALVAVLDESRVQWSYFSVALILGVVGIILVHFHEKKDSRSEKRLATNLQDIKTSLIHITENMSLLNAEKQSIDAYDIRHRIDELFSEDLTTFVEARESLAHVYGLNVYANVMSHFASGERYLNRVWSASADGYVDEITAYLSKAQVQFAEALDKICQLKDSTD
jgi:Na+/melibiose symporter-like transporter